MKQQFIKRINEKFYYFLVDMINIKNFDPNLLNIDKILFKSTNAVIYNTGYITMKSLDHVNTASENRLYLIFDNLDGYIIEENKGNKDLIFASTNNNKEVLQKYTKV